MAQPLQIRRAGDYAGGRLEIAKGEDFNFALDVYQHGVPVATHSSGAFITIYDGADSVKLARTPMSRIAGDDGNTVNRMTYTASGSIFDQADEAWVAVVEFTLDGVDYFHRVLFDVVRYPIQLTVREDDLFVWAPVLRGERVLARHDGDATGATASTLVDSDLAGSHEFDADEFAGGVVQIIDGTGEDQVRTVSAYNAATGTFTVEPDWNTTPDTTSVYRARASWQRTIAAAFEVVKLRLRSLGRRPSLIVDSEDLRHVVVHLSCAMAFEAMPHRDDMTVQSAAHHRREYEDAWSRLQFRYDAGDDSQAGAPVAQSSIVRRA